MKNKEFILNVSETVPDRPSSSSSERTCAECGRQFFISRMDLWAYRFDVKGHTSWFCRYNCLRAGQKKLENAKVRRKKELSKKPSKEVLEKDLRSGLPIAQIAKKHEGSVQSVHNWIKAYGLAGIQGIKKPKEEIPELTIPPEIMNYYADTEVQESPTLAEIEQFHTDIEIQELPKVETYVTSMTNEEFDRIMSTVDVQLVEPPCEPITAEPDPIVEETLEGIWQGIADHLALAKIKYAEQADKEFRDHLLSLVLAVTNGRGI